LAIDSPLMPAPMMQALGYCDIERPNLSAADGG